jgi:hypothetical protein
VAVEVGRDGVAHVGTISRCGSPWVCPLCAPVVRERRAQEIDRGLGVHLAAGGGVEFVSLTVRHYADDELAGRLALMATLVGLCLMGKGWAARRGRLGYVGAIRAIDITWGRANGWHPHVHFLLLFERPLTDDERVDLGDWLYGRLVAVSERAGFGVPTREHGLDIQAVRSSSDLAEYLAKVEGGWGAGLEVARADLKSGKDASRYTPWRILAEVAEDHRCNGWAGGPWANLWREYDAATFGKRAIVWSAGLKARLGVDDVDDEDLAASEGTEEVKVLRFLVDRGRWDYAVRAGRQGELLDAIEDWALVLIWWADTWGHDLPALT